MIIILTPGKQFCMVLMYSYAVEYCTNVVQLFNHILNHSLGYRPIDLFLILHKYSNGHNLHWPRIRFFFVLYLFLSLVGGGGGSEPPKLSLAIATSIPQLCLNFSYCVLSSSCGNHYHRNMIMIMKITKSNFQSPWWYMYACRCRRNDEALSILHIAYP